MQEHIPVVIFDSGLSDAAVPGKDFVSLVATDNKEGGVLAGALTYLALLRWTRSLDSADRSLLLDSQRQLPGWMRGSYGRLVRVLVA